MALLIIHHSLLPLKKNKKKKTRGLGIIHHHIRGKSCYASSLAPACNSPAPAAHICGFCGLISNRCF